MKCSLISISTNTDFYFRNTNFIVNTCGKIYYFSIYTSFSFIAFISFITFITTRPNFSSISFFALNALNTLFSSITFITFVSFKFSNNPSMRRIVYNFSNSHPYKIATNIRPILRSTIGVSRIINYRRKFNFIIFSISNSKRFRPIIILFNSIFCKLTNRNIKYIISIIRFRLPIILYGVGTII